MDIQEIKNTIRETLPRMMETDPEIREIILSLGRDTFIDRRESDRRFDRLLDEIAEARRQSDARWAEHRRESEQRWLDQLAKLDEKWEAAQKRGDARWAEHQRESEQRWLDQLAKLDEKWEAAQKRGDARWAEHQRESEQRWLDQLAKLDEKWEAQQKRIDERWQAHQRESESRWSGNQEEHEIFMRRLDTGNSALEAYCGLRSEASFRNALRGILSETFGVEVVHVNEYDDEGIVFGRPDQVELDLIIRDGTLIICEIKSSMSKGDVSLFERKARFYESRHGRTADRMVIISPMVDDAAEALARKVGVEIYSHAEDVADGRGD